MPETIVVSIVIVDPSQGAVPFAMVISSPMFILISESCTMTSNSLLSSLFSLKIPVPVPSSSTTAVSVKGLGRVPMGMFNKTLPLSDPSIGISVMVIDCPTNKPSA